MRLGALVLLGVLAIAPLSLVFDGGLPLTIPLAVALGAGVAALCRWRRLGVELSAVAAAVTLVVYVGAVTSTATLAGAVPTPGSVVDVWQGITEGWLRLLTVGLPTTPRGLVLAGPLALGLLVGWLGVELRRTPQSDPQVDYTDQDGDSAEAEDKEQFTAVPPPCVPDMIVPLEITIERIQAIDVFDDFGGRADFYVDGAIGEHHFGNRGASRDLNNIAPGWRFQHEVDVSHDVSVTISVWDNEGGDRASEDADVTPGAGSSVHVSVDVRDGSFTSPAPGGPSGRLGDSVTTAGGAQHRKAVLTFSIRVLQEPVFC